MTSPRGSKYPACSITLDGRSAFSFSRASTPFEVCNACLKHLTGRLFPDKPGSFAAPAEHAVDLEILFRELDAKRKSAGSSDDKALVVTLRIFRGDLEGIRLIELTETFELKAYLDGLRHWRQTESTDHTAKLKRTGTRKSFHCSRTARLGWGVQAPEF